MSSRLEVGKDCGCLESYVYKEVNDILDWGKVQVSSLLYYHLAYRLCFFTKLKSTHFCLFLFSPRKRSLRQLLSGARLAFPRKIHDWITFLGTVNQTRWQGYVDSLKEVRNKLGREKGWSAKA